MIFQPYRCSYKNILLTASSAEDGRNRPIKSAASVIEWQLSIFRFFSRDCANIWHKVVFPPLKCTSIVKHTDLSYYHYQKFSIPVLKIKINFCLKWLMKGVEGQRTSIKQMNQRKQPNTTRNSERNHIHTLS